MKQEVNFLQKPFITIGAIFEDELPIAEALAGKELPPYSRSVYTFKAETNANLQVGDFALVHANDELKIVRVVEVHDTPQIDPEAHFQYKWVVQRIDLEPYRHRLEEEKQLNRMVSHLVFVEKKQGLINRMKSVAEIDGKIAQFLQKYLSSHRDE